MSEWVTPLHDEFFDRISEEAKKLVNEIGGKFENIAIQIERDFRGEKFETLSIRVLRYPDGKRGLMEEQRYE